MALSLANSNLEDIKEGTRVQSFQDRGIGDIIKVDRNEGIVWVYWYASGAVVPYDVQHTSSDVFSIDN